MPRSFGRPGITVSPAALRYGPRFTGRFFLTFGRAYGTSSYNSGCSSKISGSFIRNAPKSSSVVGDTVCTSSTNRRFDSLRYNSYRFNVRTKTLKCLTRDSDNLCVARYSTGKSLFSFPQRKSPSLAAKCAGSTFRATRA